MSEFNFKRKSPPDFERMFDSLAEMGVNPCAGAFTTAGPETEEYEAYAKNRLEQVKAGLDSTWKLVEFVAHKILKK